MTYWATLYYAGAVVLSMGYEGQTLEQCNQMGQLIMQDIESAYSNPETVTEIAKLGVFPINDFSFSCETEQLPVDERYAE